MERLAISVFLAAGDGLDLVMRAVRWGKRSVGV